MEESGPMVNFDGKRMKMTKSTFEICSEGGHVLATRSQYPLKLAFALTIHRAQGQTLPQLVVDCYGFFKAGQMGVAVGRATCKDGLQVLNYNPEAARMKHPAAVGQFYERVSMPLTNVCCFGFVEPTQQDEDHGGDDHDDGDEGHDGDDDNELPAVEHTQQEPMDDDDDNNEDHDVDDDDDELPDAFPSDVVTFLDEVLPTQRYTVQQQDLLQAGDLLKGNHVRNLQRFLNRSWDTIVQLYRIHVASERNKTTGIYEVHRCTFDSASHTKNRKLLYPKGEVTVSAQQLSTRLVRHCVRLITDQKVQDVLRCQEETLLEKPTDTNPDVFRAKIRYLAGACIARITQKLRRSLSNKMLSLKGNQLIRAIYHRIQILSVLRISEVTVYEETSDVTSLKEIDWKQGVSRGLWHVDDKVYQFFISLHATLAPLVTSEVFNLHVEDMHPYLQNRVYGDATLKDKWNSLFVLTDHEATSLDESCLLDLYELVTDHYVKILLGDNLTILKESLPRKKKLALRPSLHSDTTMTSWSRPVPSSTVSSEPSTSRPVPSSTVSCDPTISSPVPPSNVPSESTISSPVPPSTAEDEEIYPCGVCGDPCEDSPKTNDAFSVGCDGCQIWCHYGCVGLTNKAKLASRWFCPTCEEKGIGTNRGPKNRKRKK